MPWQLLTIVSITALSCSVLLQRVLLHRYRTDPIAYAIVFQNLTGLLILSYAIVHGYQLPDLRLYWFPSLVAITFFATGHVLYANAIQRIEASIFSVLFSTSAVWVMVGGVLFLSENLSLRHAIGSAVVFTSVLLLVEQRSKALRERTVLLGLLTGLVFGIASTAWAYVGRESDAASWTSITFLGPGLLVLATNPRHVSQLRKLLKKAILLRLALLATLFGTGAVTLQLAYQRGNVSVVAPLWQTNVILTTLLAIIILKEHQRLWYKLAAAGVCVVGASLLVV